MMRTKKLLTTKQYHLRRALGFYAIKRHQHKVIALCALAAGSLCAWIVL
jgi:hypothetical protein